LFFYSSITYNLFYLFIKFLVHTIWGLTRVPNPLARGSRRRKNMKWLKRKRKRRKLKFPQSRTSCIWTSPSRSSTRRSKILSTMRTAAWSVPIAPWRRKTRKSTRESWPGSFGPRYGGHIVIEIHFLPIFTNFHSFPYIFPIFSMWLFIHLFVLDLYYHLLV